MIYKILLLLDISPRLCHLYLGSEETCFGFNLYKRKGDDKQYIGDIDIDSPADIVGLRAGDMLIEVTDIKIDDMITQCLPVHCCVHCPSDAKYGSTSRVKWIIFEDNNLDDIFDIQG